MASVLERVDRLDEVTKQTPKTMSQNFFLAAERLIKKLTIINTEDRFVILISCLVINSALIVNPQSWTDDEALQDCGWR